METYHRAFKVVVMYQEEVGMGILASGWVQYRGYQEEGTSKRRRIGTGLDWMSLLNVNTPRMRVILCRFGLGIWRTHYNQSLPSLP